MPRLSGLDLAHQMHRVAPEVPIALMAPRVNALPRSVLRAAGIVAIVPKPIGRIELLNALGRALTEARASRLEVGLRREGAALASE